MESNILLWTGSSGEKMGCLTSHGAEETLSVGLHCTLNLDSDSGVSPSPTSVHMQTSLIRVSKHSGTCLSPIVIWVQALLSGSVYAAQAAAPRQKVRTALARLWDPDLAIVNPGF